MTTPPQHQPAPAPHAAADAQPGAGSFALGRRALLAAGAGAGAAALATALPQPADAAATAEQRRGARFFRHGVASGDPRPTSVILWTRVTPTDAAQPGSGAGPRVTVRWQVATDRAFEQLVASGRQETGPARDHTVKVDATGLRPDRTYYYRFTHAGGHSATGRTRTAPADDSTPENVRLGVVSCANLQAGYFHAYRHLERRDDLHAVLHLGDYLYEYGPGEYGYGQSDRDIRTHRPRHEMVSLADYRQRHAQYKRDPDLRALHAKYAFIVTWDDHETANDAWKHGAENHQPDEGDFAARKAAARRAYDEWMPVRLDGTTKIGDGTQVFRRLRFGRLAELSMLDLRTYRSQQASGPQAQDEVNDPERTITGDKQMEWLKESLRERRALWKVVGNPVMIAPVRFGNLSTQVTEQLAELTGTPTVEGVPYNVDQWDGYTADRRELYRHIRNHSVLNTVFLTGDIHSAWAAELPYDAGNDLSDSAGTEFVCTSVTSNNLDDITGSPPRTTSIAVEEAIKAANRHVKYLNFDDHGYSVVDITTRRLQMDYWVVGDRANKKAGAHHVASWATRVDTQRVHAVDKPVEG